MYYSNQNRVEIIPLRSYRAQFCEILTKAGFNAGVLGSALSIGRKIYRERFARLALPCAGIL